MQILKEEIIEIFIRLEKKYEDLYEDKTLNEYANNYKGLAENRKSIMLIIEKDLETVLYSEYYWYTKFKDYYQKIYGEDAGVEQGQFKLIEEIEGELEQGVDWGIIQSIEEDLD